MINESYSIWQLIKKWDDDGYVKEFIINKGYYQIGLVCSSIYSITTALIIMLISRLTEYDVGFLIIATILGWLSSAKLTRIALNLKEEENSYYREKSNGTIESNMDLKKYISLGTDEKKINSNRLLISLEFRQGIAFLVMALFFVALSSYLNGREIKNDRLLLEKIQSNNLKNHNIIIWKIDSINGLRDETKRELLLRK